jgi:hypothetical protein
VEVAIDGGAEEEREGEAERVGGGLVCGVEFVAKACPELTDAELQGAG